MRLSSICESSSRTTYYTVLDGTQETVVGIPPQFVSIPIVRVLLLIDLREVD